MVVIRPCRLRLTWFCAVACLIFTSTLSVIPSSAQPGFISIDCGGSDNFTSLTNLTWVTDGTYVTTGQSATLPDFNNLSTVYQTVRYFPEDTPKSCYELPASTGMSYLIRAAFYYGNYDKKNTLPIFSLIVDGTVLVDPVSANDAVYELYVPAMSTSLSVCVARSRSAGSPTLAGNPFITYLQLRPIGPGTSYDSVVLNNGHGLYGIYTIDLGSNSSYSLRYPNDTIDRIWTPFASLNSTNLETTHEVLGGLGSTDYACPVMLQTATMDLIMPYPLTAISSQNQYHVLLFFAEIDPKVTTPGKRVFDIYSNTHLNGTEPWASGIDIFDRSGGQYRGLRLASTSPVTPVDNSILISFKPTQNSTYGPIISGIQVLLYTNNPLSNSTNDLDASTIRYVRDYYEITASSGDPCMPSGYSWTWIMCTPASSLGSNIPRITSIRLSKIPLKGNIIPEFNDLAELTELRLDDNQLTGAIPILGALQYLETLDLSNNKLTGGIPSWLADLPSLQQLHLENNFLEGEVPSELLTLADRGNLNFTYGGNTNLTCNGGQSCDSSSTLPSPPPPTGQASTLLPPPPTSSATSYKASVFFVLSIYLNFFVLPL